MTLQKNQSLRSKLLVLYFCVLMIPMLVIVYVMPSFFYNLIMDKTSKQTESIQNAIARNMESYLDDLDRLTVTPYMNDNVIEALKLKNSPQYNESDDYTKLLTERVLRNGLPNLISNFRSDILGVLLLSLDGSTYLLPNSQGGDVTEDYPFREQEWYQETIEADGNTVFISPHLRDYVTNPAVTHAFSVARLIKDPDTKKPLAVLKADANTTVIDHMMKDIEFDVASIVTIYDQDNQLIYSNKYLSEDVQAEVIKADRIVNGEDDSYIKISKKMEDSGWSIITLLSESEMKRNVKSFHVFGILFAVVGIAASFALFRKMSVWIIKPYHKLIEAMNRFRRGDWEARIDANNGNGEIHELSLAYNMMADQISEMVKREYIAKLQLKEAEFRALQSQIQPHFLYNTLNGFIGLNRMEKRDVLEEAIISLSRMMRYTLEDHAKSTLREEFDFLHSYCELQKMRFGDKLIYEITYDKNVGACRIPKLLLQPLVENAIIHGIEPLRRPANLKLSAFYITDEDNQWLTIELEDTGKGFDLEENRQNSIGLSNTEERLKLLYSESIFEIESIEGQGTKVRIQIRKDEVIG